MSDEPTTHELPDAAVLHERFFARWHRDDARSHRATTGLRNDLESIPAFRGVDAAELCPLSPRAEENVKQQIARMVAAARSDWNEIVAPHDVLSREGLAAIDASFDDSTLLDLITSSDPADFANSFVVTCCELGAVIGEALRAARPGLAWVADWPYWESALVDRATGDAIPPFHWALKRLSASSVRDGLHEGLVEKIGLALSVLAKKSAR